MSLNNKSNMKMVPIMVTAFIILAETIISLNSVFLPDIKSDFVISSQMAQTTLTIGLFALGFAGIIYGGISESFGRRPVFLFSIILLSFATLIAGLSNSITIFMLARLLQGLGSGAGWVIGNACLKDIYHGKEYTKIMNIVHAVAGITPAVIPIIGSYLMTTIGWRNTFLILFFISSILSLAIFFFQNESIVAKEHHNIKNIYSSYKSIFLNNQFVKYCTIKVLAVSLIFCEISTLPLVYMNYLGVLHENYGYYLLPSFLCYVIASIFSSHLAKNIKIDILLQTGLGMIILSNLVLILISLIIDIKSAILIQSIKSFTYAGWGFVFGNATAEIVSSIPRKAGNTSAMMIALEMLASALIVFLLGFFFDGTILPLSICMVIIGFMALLPIRLIKN